MDFVYLQKVRNMALDDVVILNVDTNTLETPFDDLQSLPNDVVGNEFLRSTPACLRHGNEHDLECVEGKKTAVVFLWPKNCGLFLCLP